jgi:hypothetical protein
VSANWQPMYVRLPRDLHVAVKARAVDDERTMAQTIRHALRLYLAQGVPHRTADSDATDPTGPAHVGRSTTAGPDGP